MPPLDPLRSFLPIANPLGFGAADFLELALAAILVVFALVSRRSVEPLARRLAQRPVWCMALLAAAPIILRLLLLANHPVPTPDIYDEFGHLLVADTLRHFRLANPPHVLPQFFETFFVLQRPTYSSIYPIGQGLALAIGWTLFGTPWAGVLLATGAFCALCYWMLRGWVSSPWALIGAALAVIEFGPLCQWTNGYWGGDVTACAGCLVFGALPRLKASPTRRDAALLGLGIAIHLLTRPYESIFLFAAAVLYLAPVARSPKELRAIARVMPLAAAFVTAAVFITLAQNKAVTGSWTTLPYQLSQYQYGVPAALTFQTNPRPHIPLTREQQMDYRMQSSFRGPSAETLSSFLLRLEFRVRYYRFFFSARVVSGASVISHLDAAMEMALGGHHARAFRLWHQFLSGLPAPLRRGMHVPHDSGRSRRPPEACLGKTKRGANCAVSLRDPLPVLVRGAPVRKNRYRGRHLTV